MNRRYGRWTRTALAALLATFAVVAGDAAFDVDREACAQALPSGCAAGGTSTTPAGGFTSTNFDFNSSSVDTNGFIQLDTGATSLDPNSIVIPFDQEIYTTFLLEGAGYVSSIGWFVLGEAETKLGYTLNAPLNFNNLTAAGVDIHYLFRSVEDQNSGCCDGGDGILNKYYSDTDAYLGSTAGLTEAALTGWGFAVESSAITGFTAQNGVDPRDMRKYMGLFAAGTEIVYFLHPNDNIASTWYSKTELNGDTWNPSSATKRDAKLIFDLAIASPEQGGPATVYDTGVSPVTATQGFIPIAARDRLGNPDGKAGYPADGYFDIKMSGTQSMTMTRYQRYSHFMLATPPNDPFKWILGVEDLSGGGDADFNDMMILIHRKTGGVAQLKAANALSPGDPNAYITTVSVNVTDEMPCDGLTQIKYYLSINNGGDWVELADWSVVRAPDAGGAEIVDWTYGNPSQTYREATVNFSELGIVGRELTWKAEMVSELESCIPKIHSFNLSYAAAINTEFSRSSPIVLANVLYSSSFETPAATWVDTALRGHLYSTELYDPLNPNGGMTNVSNWDAGQVVTAAGPAGRNLKTPNVTLVPVVGHVIATGDGATTVFGTEAAPLILPSAPIVHSTVTITDGTEIFHDKRTTVLEGSLTGTGTINRYTGAVTLVFNTPPALGADITADYTGYIALSTLKNFTSVSTDELALNNSQVTDATGTHYVYDLNNDGAFSAADGTALTNWVRGYRDGGAVTKEWLLSAIDHSSPAVVGAPGYSSWYFGSEVNDATRDTYDVFRCQQRSVSTLVMAGSQMGTLHGFYGGESRPYYIDPAVFPNGTSCAANTMPQFRNATNNLTVGGSPYYPSPGGNVIINRGYYAWESGGAPTGAPNYGDGSEVWGVIPTDQLPKLKNNMKGAEDSASVDASPSVAYVQFADQSWHAVVMSAEGNGGDHVFALDVTDPATPTFLWDYADPDLYRSRSNPSVGVVGRIQTSAGGKWVVFFVSGVSQDATLDPSVYMLDIETGSVISRIFLDSAGGAGLGGTPSGQPAVVDIDGNGYADRLYIGSDKGFMYKVSLPDSGSVSGGVTACPTVFFDAGLPIYASPAVAIKTTIDANGTQTARAIVLFGTSDSPWQVDATGATYKFFAVEDTGAKGSCSAGSLLWSMDLPPGERVFASAFATANRVYFGTTTAETDDPCSPTVDGGGAGGGLGSLYGLDLETGAVVLQETGVGNFSSAPVVDDDHLYTKTSDGQIKGYGGDVFQNQGIVKGTGNATSAGWREIL